MPNTELGAEAFVGDLDRYGLIVYGGAFDPPHQGHIDCVRLAAQRFKAAKILITPAFAPAGAAAAHKQTSASFAMRQALCEIAFSPVFTGIGRDRLAVSTIESSLPTPSYTVQTLAALAGQYPQMKLCFLVGQDQLESFHLWHEPLEILRRSSLIVIKRDTTSGYGGLLKKSVETLAERLKEPIEWRPVQGKEGTEKPQAVFTRLGSWIYIIDQPISVAASSLIRQLLSKGQRLPADWVPPPVEEYIREHRLYQ